MSSEARNEIEPIVCSICLTSPVTKVVGTCAHAFCTTCLSKHLTSIGEDSKTFLCPTCKVEYPMPADGISGLVDCSQDGQTMVKAEAAAAEEESLQDEPSKCLSCFYRTKDSVQAKHICIDCGDMVLCDGCTKAHRENEVTKDHVILPLNWSRRTEEHALLAKDYCFTCSKQVCHLCVQFEHGKHLVRKLGEAFLEMTQQVQTITEDHKSRSVRLQYVGEELKVLKSSALDERDAIVKKIEDEAEKRIEEILKQKEDLKKEVRNEFSFVEEVVTCLDTIPDLVERLDETVADAETFLAEPVRHIARLEKIISLRDSMVTYGQLADQVDDENLWENYESHRQTRYDFVPATEEYSIGATSTQTTHNIKLCSMVYEHVLDVDDDTNFIPSVTSVGSKYALAHPTSADKPASAFDVYAFPGTYERTVTDHVSPLYGMTRTPEGKIAILSDGTSPEDSYCVRHFDTEAGYVRSSSDIKLRGFIAFDVNMRGQYVILSEECDRNTVTVARNDGTVVLQQNLDDEDIEDLEDPRRIVANGSYYFIMGRNGVAVYRHNTNILDFITVRLNKESTFHDISSMGNEITVIYHIKRSPRKLRFGRTSLGDTNDKLHSWCCVGAGFPDSPGHAQVVDANMCNLSVSRNHIVASECHTVRVYEEKY